MKKTNTGKLTIDQKIAKLENKKKALEIQKEIQTLKERQRALKKT